MFTLGSHSSCNKINSWLLLHPVFKRFNICFSLNKHSLKKAIDCMFQPVATIVFILGKWHLQVQEKLMRRTLKATSVREEEEELSQRLTCGNDSSFFVFFFYKFQALFPPPPCPSPRHWGQGFSRAVDERGRMTRFFLFCISNSVLVKLNK